MKQKYPSPGESVWVWSWDSAGGYYVAKRTFIRRSGAWVYWRTSGGVEYKVNGLEDWGHDPLELGIEQLRSDYTCAVSGVYSGTSPKFREETVEWFIERARIVCGIAASVAEREANGATP